MLPKDGTCENGECVPHTTATNPTTTTATATPCPTECCSNDDCEVGLRAPPQCFCLRAVDLSIYALQRFIHAWASYLLNHPCLPGFCISASQLCIHACALYIHAWEQLFCNFPAYRLLLYRFCLCNSLFYKHSPFDRVHFPGRILLRERRVQEALHQRRRLRGRQRNLQRKLRQLPILLRGQHLRKWWVFKDIFDQPWTK